MPWPVVPMPTAPPPQTGPGHCREVTGPVVVWQGLPSSHLRGNVVPRSQRHSPVAWHTFWVLASFFPIFVQGCVAVVWHQPKTCGRAQEGGQARGGRCTPNRGQSGEVVQPGSRALTAKPEDLPNLLNRLERGES